MNSNLPYTTKTSLIKKIFKVKFVVAQQKLMQSLQFQYSLLKSREILISILNIKLLSKTMVKFN